MQHFHVFSVARLTVFFVTCVVNTAPIRVTTETSVLAARNMLMEIHVFAVSFRNGARTSRSQPKSISTGLISAELAREVSEFDSQGDLRAVRAMVPIAEMFAYSSALRGATQGRGNYSMELAEYRDVPAGIAKKMMEQDA